MDSISLTQARRLALAAQGFAGRRSDAVSGWRRMRSALDHMALLQIDTINTLIRSHYLPLFSRVGHYDIATLDRKAFDPKRRELFEYWGHEASLLPLALHPLLRWRMARAERCEGVYGQIGRLARERPQYIRQILDHIRDNGPLSARDLGVRKTRTGMWAWHDGKIALEYLFWSGRLTAVTRRGFERVYDLTERALPAEIIDLPTPAEADAQRQLLGIAARALGVATAGDLRDYFRLSAADANRRIEELVEAGALLPVQVESWQQPAYLDPQAQLPRRVNTTALLTPFDPLVWERSRSERLFDFHYRIEIYKPQAQRRYGYYVLPFLHNERLRARVDLKADRRNRTLRVLAAHGENGEDYAHVAATLWHELQRLTRWLGLERIELLPRGDLASALHRQRQTAEAT